MEKRENRKIEEFRKVDYYARVNNYLRILNIRNEELRAVELGALAPVELKECDLLDLELDELNGSFGEMFYVANRHNDEARKRIAQRVSDKAQLREDQRQLLTGEIVQLHELAGDEFDLDQLQIAIERVVVENF